MLDDLTCCDALRTSRCQIRMSWYLHQLPGWIQKGSVSSTTMRARRDRHDLRTSTPEARGRPASNSSHFQLSGHRQPATSRGFNWLTIPSRIACSTTMPLLDSGRPVSQKDPEIAAHPALEAAKSGRVHTVLRR